MQSFKIRCRFIMGVIVGVLCLFESVVNAAASSSANASVNKENKTELPVVVDAAYLAKAANRIDVLINDHLSKNGLQPNAKITDVVYARRVYLNLIGRIPTQQEVLAFLGDKSTDRRSRLAAQLLKSNGYNSHMFNWYADMFRVTDIIGRAGSGEFFQQWLRDSLRANKPWDSMVYDMMTVEGTYAEHGELGLLQRDAGMPLDGMSNTMSVFLGANVSCAQCHDHPFADWSQRDFYSMAAFFGTTDITNIDGRKVADKYNKALGSLFSRHRVVELLAPNIQRAIPGQSKWLTFPEDYTYKDAKPGDKVPPVFMVWGKEKSPAYVPVNVQKKDTLRQQFATWLTNPQNPRFATNIANRVWKKIFGLAVQEPVTDIDDLSAASNPALLAYLTEEMRRLKFDLRAFQGLLVSTEAYQRQAGILSNTNEMKYHFTGPVMRRMTAEQVWDSLMTTMRGDDLDLNQTDKTKELKSLTIPQGELSDKEVVNLVKRAEAQPKEKKQGSQQFTRASELKQPETASHLLRYLGQSDRNVIDDGNQEGGIAQALNMLNGKTIEAVCAAKSHAINAALKAGSPDSQVRSLYVSLLTRQPTSSQLQQITSAMSKGMTLSDIAWTIINGREFIFIQ